MNDRPIASPVIDYRMPNTASAEYVDMNAVEDTDGRMVLELVIPLAIAGIVVALACGVVFAISLL